MSILARLVRRLVWIRFGRNSAESDIVTDYLERDRPDYAGALRAWRAFDGVRLAAKIIGRL